VPVAAYIANGIPFSEIGTKTTHFVDLQFSLGENRGDQIVGKIVYIDRFGNLITNIPSEILPKDVEQKKTTLISGESQWEQLSFVSSYGFVKPGDRLLTIGSNSFLEISINQGNAAQTLMIKEDAEIQLFFS
jgi:hypothetical protein